MTVAWNFADVFVISLVSRRRVLLLLSVVQIDFPEMPCLLLVLSPSVLVSFSGPVFSSGSADGLVTCIALVELDVVIALHVLNCAFYDGKEDLSLNSN